MCNNSSILGILSLIKRIVLLIQIIVPIILIVFAITSFIKLIKNPELKDGTKKIINQFLAAAIVFFIPMLVNVVMNLIDDKTDFTSCWKSIPSTITLNNSYYDINGNNRKEITPSSNNYQRGKSDSTTNSQGGNGNSTTFNLEHAIQVGDSVHAKENANYSWHGKRIGGYGGDIGAYTEAVNILNETDYRIYEVYNTIISAHPEQANSDTKGVYQLTDINNHFNIKASYIDRNVNSIKQALSEGKLVQAITDTNLFRNSKGNLVSWSGVHWGLIFYYDGTYFHMKNSGSIKQKNAIYTEKQLAEWLNSNNIKARPIVYKKK